MNPQEYQQAAPQVAEMLGQALAIVKFANEFEPKSRDLILSRMSPDLVDVYNCWAEVTQR